MKYRMYLVFVLLVQQIVSFSAYSADSADDSDNVDVESIKKKYWAKGDESELGVIQNRKFSKAGRFHLGVTGGYIFSDPFLSIKSYGLTTGYFFNEKFGVHLNYSKINSTPSTAYQLLLDRGAKANTNKLNGLATAEGTYSPMYGKLSLFGNKIVYYDFHLAGGGGMMQTENGNVPAFVAGLGQRFYMNQHFSFTVDYRMVNFKETIIEREIPTKIGQKVGERNNFSHTIFVGIDFMFGSGGK